MDKQHKKKHDFLLLIFALTFLLQLNLFSQEIRTWEEKLKIKEKPINSDSISWDKGAIVNLGFNNVGLSNWAGGGQSSISVFGMINSYLNYQHHKISWDNQIIIAYGIIKTGNGDELPWMKNDDRIEITSKYGRKTKYKWDYTLLFNFRTQFNYGYNSIEDRLNNNYFSSIFSPAFPITALGVDYKPNENLACFLSPATIKTTIVLDDLLSSNGSFGIQPGKHYRIEAGGYLNFMFQHKNLFNVKDLGFKTNFSLFSNYNENPQNIDITWETLTSYKLKKLLTLTFSTNLVYDHDIKFYRYEKDGTPIYLTDNNNLPYLDDENNPIQKKGAITQYKQTLTLGLMFTF